jgi:acetate kinase
VARVSTLVVNAGSTSTKLSVIDRDDATPWSCEVATGADAIAGALDDAGSNLDGVSAVGHRIVHGGQHLVEPVVFGTDVLAEIADVAELAPLHNAAGIAGVHAARARFPDRPQVLCFDTAFHASMPDAARAYGGPSEWLERGFRRYGFHGLSHEYATQTAGTLLGRPVDELRIVTCHLGGGCSLAAVDGGRSVDTTMGFTPLDGLVMTTRSGSVDPGLLLRLLREGTDVDELDDLLERRSGLLGLSGVSGDLRALVTARDGGDERARLAVDVFVHRLVAGMGAMAAVLGGLDAFVFTGGIGEHSEEVRARAIEPFAWLDARLDDEANGADGDRDISATGTTVRVLVVTAREDLVIARSTRRLVAGSRGP